MYSAGNYNAPADSSYAYRVEYATADSPLGPFVRAKNNPILVSDGSINLASPGHNSVLHLPGTDDWYIVYHAHRGEVERKVFINRMAFDAQGQIRKITPDRQGVPSRPIHGKLALSEPGLLRAGDTLTMEATSDWPKDEVKSVTFYAGKQELAVLRRAPYRFVWKAVPAGFYSIYAHVTHQSGELAVSSAWNVDVVEPDE